MVDKSEETRLNRAGAEIRGDRVYLGLDNIYWLRGPGDYAKIWTPCHDLNHTAMVLESFDNWDLSRQNSKDRKGRIYTCIIYIGKNKFYGQSDNLKIACMLAVEQAMNSEKG